jgi:hypothetical protein
MAVHKTIAETRLYLLYAIMLLICQEQRVGGGDLHILHLLLCSHFTLYNVQYSNLCTVRTIQGISALPRHYLALLPACQQSCLVGYLKS